MCPFFLYGCSPVKKLAVHVLSVHSGEDGMKQKGSDQCLWCYLATSQSLTQITSLARKLPTVQVIYLHAFAPVAKWPASELVLSSHTENVLLGFDIDFILGVLGGGVLHKTRGNILQTKKCDSTGSQQKHVTAAKCNLNLIYMVHVLITIISCSSLLQECPLWTTLT